MYNEQIVQDFLELVKLPVQSRNERAIADNVKAKLTALGLEVTEDALIPELNGNTGNIRAVLKGSADIEPILFSAHLDRVKNNNHVNPIFDEENKTFKADGETILAADDVSGICVILDALRRIKASDKPHGDIEVALSVCEEAGVLGSKYFDFDSFKARKAYVFDAPGHIGRIIVQAPSKCKFSYKVHGKSAHAGNEPEKGINAVKAAAALIMELPDNRQSQFTTANISTIMAGTTSTNVVCDYAEILAEARSTDNEEFKAVLEKFAAPVKMIEEKYGVTIDYKADVLYHTFKIEPDEDVVKIAVKAMDKLGIEPVLNKGGGGMDGNHFNYHGIKSIGIAPGYFKNHTPAEHIFIEDLIACGKLAAEIAWNVK